MRYSVKKVNGSWSVVSKTKSGPGKEQIKVVSAHETRDQARIARRALSKPRQAKEAYGGHGDSDAARAAAGAKD